jgi:hypothetical protein
MGFEAKAGILASHIILLMQICTVNPLFFEYSNEGGDIASLQYNDQTYNQGQIITTKAFAIRSGGTGVWMVTAQMNAAEKKISIIRSEPGGWLTMTECYRKKKYFFRKSQQLRLRFSLADRYGGELLTLLPSVNWKKQSYNYVLQLNEEYEKETDSFLILQAVHCANVSLSMMTGGPVPALVNI